MGCEPIDGGSIPLDRPMNIRNFLEQSGLFLEGVEKIGNGSCVNFYYGFNVTKTDKEPIDQLQAFIAAKRIQEYNTKQFGKSGIFISFIGGLFEILNCKNLKEVDDLIKLNTPKEKSKKLLFKSIYKKYVIKGLVLTTKDLWLDQNYWKILKGLFDQQIFTRGLLINDSLSFYETKEQLFNTIKVKELPKTLVNLPLNFIKKIGNFPASILYTPAEVSEAYYLKEKFSVVAKIGQVQERIYDKYLYKDFSVFRLKQPVSLNSLQEKPKVVTPYIDKDVFELSGIKKQNVRLYFTDTLNVLTNKISQTPAQEYVFITENNFGEVLNPLVEKAILAVESARAMRKTPIILKKNQVNFGKEIIDLILEGKLKLTDLKKLLPNIIYQFLIKPFKNSL